VVVNDTAAERVRRVRKTETFYETQTVRRIAEVLDFCDANATIGVITGGFGTGKTEAVNAWRRAHAGKVDSAVFEFDEFSSTNKIDFVRILGHLFGVDRPACSQNGGLVFRELCEKLRKSPCMLIFDQCESVRPRIFQIIRQIWDRVHDAGVGVVLLSAPILLTRMTQSRITDLGAIQS
jgi:DNA transposition AAA+ family ATPase